MSSIWARRSLRSSVVRTPAVPAAAEAASVPSQTSAGWHHIWLRPAADAGEEARREIEELATDLEEDVLDRSRLVATELVANCVRHAGLRRDQVIGLVVSVAADRVRIEVADEGRGFEPSVEEPAPGQKSGWGLWLVDRLTDRWGVDPGPCARVWCELDRPGKRGRRRPSASMVGALLAEEAGAAGYRRAQREALRNAMDTESAGPLEFDESGFPLPQRNPGFVARVARLLKP
jgi:anti-sigma regulatory factor (Ser/Thr protein kinase)